MAGSSTGSPFFQIPGNVKQQFAPFVLNPDSRLNLPATASTDLKGKVSPQVFSYKDLSGDYASGKAKLNFYPSSFNDAMVVQDDISFKLLYGRDNDYFKTQKSITISDILNTIPGVQIREFLPDTRLDQCINMFVDLFSSMKKVISGEKDQSDSSTSQKDPNKNKKDSEDSLFSKIKNVAWYTMKYMVGATSPDFFDDLGRLNDLPFSSYKQEIYDSFKMFGKATSAPGYFVMTFPYTLYYRLQTCVTTNIYEIPAAQSSKTILASGSGMAGWTDGGSDFMSAGGFRISDLLGKIPLVGGIANMILGNIGINYMPWWNASSGSKTKEPQIELTFDLFNDNADAALMNFIFVNTLVPNNKWIQYNMFQHSSALYDVKIEGINRLFACAGDFTVTYEGVLRDPPISWISQLVSKHANKNMNPDAFEMNIIKNKLIKIPDVYRVKMTFQSLLPANFNNYIFAYAQNSCHIVDYKDKVYDSSAISELLPQAIGKFGKRIVAAWEKGGGTYDATEKAANAAVKTESR